MSNSVIKVDDVSKYYRLGKISSGRLREDVSSLLKKKDATNQSANTNSKQFIWALKNKF